MQFLGGGECFLRVVGKQWRDLQRDPSVDTIGLLVNRPEKVPGCSPVSSDNSSPYISLTGSRSSACKTSCT